MTTAAPPSTMRWAFPAVYRSVLAKGRLQFGQTFQSWFPDGDDRLSQTLTCGFAFAVLSATGTISSASRRPSEPRLSSAATGEKLIHELTRDACGSA